MPYRLVAIDLDDTLLNNDLQISPRVQAAIQRTIEQGVQVTLATGRMFRSAYPFAQQMGLNIPLITYQGALVKNSQSGEVLYHTPLPRIYVRPVLELINTYGYHVQAYVDDELVMEKYTAEAQAYVDQSRVPVKLVPDLLSFLSQEPTKILVINFDEPKLNAMAEDLNHRFGEHLYITKSKPYYLEVLHPEATKGKALQALASRLGIRQEEVIAIGDSFNDIDMIQYAGLGVVMGNAREEIKQYADYITVSNEDDGVAEVLEKFVLKGVGI